MSFGTRMRERREALGLKQSELGELLGITGSAIGNYEKGVSSPKADILYRIFDVLRCDANYLFQDEMQVLREDKFSVTEIAIIKKYRALDEHGTKAVDSILDIEYERCCRQTAEASATTQRVIPFSRIPASAGLGEWLDSENMDMIEIPDSPEYRSADFAVTISGDSMEPTYYDGDIVLVREQDVINIGDIGVFIIDGQGYIKELGAEGLISHNDKYAVIHPTEDAYMRCFGKVIGKL